MNELQIFKNKDFGEVRTSIINDEPYFNLNDVCRILEINNPSQAKTRLNAGGVISNEVGVVTGTKSDGSDAIQYVKANFINESNLYKLIFQSRKPEAERFADWVTSEVLPTIRKHGAYMTETVIERTLTDPDYLIQLATTLKRRKTETTASRRRERKKQAEGAFLRFL